jgi:hypothetical protein
MMMMMMTTTTMMMMMLVRRVIEGLEAYFSVVLITEQGSLWFRRPSLAALRLSLTT